MKVNPAIKIITPSTSGIRFRSPNTLRPHASINESPAIINKKRPIAICQEYFLNEKLSIFIHENIKYNIKTNGIKSIINIINIATASA